MYLFVVAFGFATINMIHGLVPPAASPKLFLDSGALCPSLATMHSSLHSPLSRQLSTSSESAVPLGSASQSVPSTPVRRAATFYRVLTEFTVTVFGYTCKTTHLFCGRAAAHQEAPRRELLRHQQHRDPHVCGRHHQGGEAAVQGDPDAQVDAAAPPATLAAALTAPAGSAVLRCYHTVVSTHSTNRRTLMLYSYTPSLGE